MKLHRMALGVVVLTGLVGMAFVSQQDTTLEDKMTTAAENFVGSLSAEQKKKAVLDFDDAERTNWNFVPLQTADRKSTRKGLPLEEMTDKQRKAALELVKAGLSDEGYTQATTIMSLETILKDLEKNGAMVRNTDWYFFTVFGTPSRKGKWGWRIEGHHLSLNFTLDQGKIVSTTPAFFGANPAIVMAGDRKGLEALADVQKYSRELIESLTDEQKKVALQAKHFDEPEQKSKTPKVGKPVGLAAEKMTEKQKATLLKLLEAYTGRMLKDVGAVQLKQVKDAGIDKVHFAYSEEADKKNKPYTYRVQGPTFVVEFLNIQADSAKNPANHVHSCWRQLEGDFGLKN